MKAECDFVETKDTVTIFLYKRSLHCVDVSPVVDGPRRLSLCKGVAVDLYKDVHPDIRVVESPSRIEIHLRKVEPGRWGGICGRPAAQADSTSEGRAVEDSESEEGLSVMDLFSRIYQRSGDDVRKAMEKSFYESGGTVLSTDWDQVKSKKVSREE